MLAFVGHEMCRWTLGGTRKGRPAPQLEKLEKVSDVALFDMPNLNRFDILSIAIFCKISLSISISIFFKSVDISTIDISYRYFNKEKE